MEQALPSLIILILIDLFIFFLIAQNTPVFSGNIDKFTVDQSKLIYDTENIDDWENAEINEEDPEIFF